MSSEQWRLAAAVGGMDERMTQRAERGAQGAWRYTADTTYFIMDSTCRDALHASELIRKSPPPEGWTARGFYERDGVGLDWQQTVGSGGWRDTKTLSDLSELVVIIQHS